MDDNPVDFEKKTMKDMMFDDLSEFEALTDYESDWVDDTTKELLK